MSTVIYKPIKVQDRNRYNREIKSLCRRPKLYRRLLGMNGAIGCIPKYLWTGICIYATPYLLDTSFLVFGTEGQHRFSTLVYGASQGSLNSL